MINFLLSIKVTDSMSRVPRSLEEFAHWKGTLIQPPNLHAIYFETIFVSCKFRVAKLASVLLDTSLVTNTPESILDSFGTTHSCNLYVLLPEHNTARFTVGTLPSTTVS